MLSLPMGGVLELHDLCGTFQHKPFHESMVWALILVSCVSAGGEINLFHSALHVFIFAAPYTALTDLYCCLLSAAVLLVTAQNINFLCDFVRRTVQTFCWLEGCSLGQWALQAAVRMLYAHVWGYEKQELSWYLISVSSLCKLLCVWCFIFTLSPLLTGLDVLVQLFQLPFSVGRKWWCGGN